MSVCLLTAKAESTVSGFGLKPLEIRGHSVIEMWNLVAVFFPFLFKLYIIGNSVRSEMGLSYVGLWT